MDTIVPAALQLRKATFNKIAAVRPKQKCQFKIRHGQPLAVAVNGKFWKPGNNVTTAWREEKTTRTSMELLGETEQIGHIYWTHIYTACYTDIYSDSNC